MRPQDFSDCQILDGLRAAAAALGEPLAVTAYDAWRSGSDGGVQHHDGPTASSTLVIRRFGSWTGACQEAGVGTNTTRSTSRRWSDEEVVAIVARYLAAGGASYAGYVAWAREPEQKGAVPSGATLRQRFPLWNELKERAAAIQGERP